MCLAWSQMELCRAVNIFAACFNQKSAFWGFVEMSGLWLKVLHMKTKRVSKISEFLTAHSPPRGALECNLTAGLTGRCPFFKNLDNPFGKKICISILCFGISIRLQKIPKTIEKTIVYCS